MYLEGPVSVEYFLCLNDLVWLLHLNLNSPSNVPQQSLRLSVAVTSALYTMHLAKHLPARGQLSLYLQLHNLVGFFPSVKTFSAYLCVFRVTCSKKQASQEVLFLFTFFIIFFLYEKHMEHWSKIQSNFKKQSSH